MSVVKTFAIEMKIKQKRLAKFLLWDRSCRLNKIIKGKRRKLEMVGELDWDRKKKKKTKKEVRKKKMVAGSKTRWGK